MILSHDWPNIRAYGLLYGGWRLLYSFKSIGTVLWCRLVDPFSGWWDKQFPHCTSSQSRKKVSPWSYLLFYYVFTLFHFLYYFVFHGNLLTMNGMQNYSLILQALWKSRLVCKLSHVFGVPGTLSGWISIQFFEVSMTTLLFLVCFQWHITSDINY